MKRMIATRKLRRQCAICDRHFYKGDVYYIDRKVFEEFGEVYASEHLICPRCKYREEEREKRYEAFKSRCEHPEKFVYLDHCYYPNDPAPVPSHEMCMLCGQVV